MLERYNENFPMADRETILARLESYIHGVLDFVQTNYPGIIYAWDVVNEIVDEGAFRKSIWAETVGEDFFIKAFEFARKYADLNNIINTAVKNYISDVKLKKFPEECHIFKMTQEEKDKLYNANNN